MNMQHNDWDFIFLLAIVFIAIATSILQHKVRRYNWKERILNRIYQNIIPIAILLIGILVFFYRSSSLLDNSTLGNTEKFGQLGDYIGGLLNPIFGFITVLLLIHSLKTERAHKRSQLNFVKNEILLTHFQKLIVSFSNIISTSEETWSDDRKQKLQKLAEEISSAKIIVATLNNQIGEKIDHWYSTKNNTHESVMTVTIQLLSQLNTDLDKNKKDFLMEKSKELSRIYHEFLDNINS